MAVKAYVLITVEPERTPEVVRRVSSISEVVEIHEVMGPFDIVAELEVAELTDVADLLKTQIRPTPGIKATVTCVALT